MDLRLERGLEAGVYGDLAFQFGRFVLEQDGRAEAEPLAVVAALLAERTLCGDTCLDLRAPPPALEAAFLERVREQVRQSPVVLIPGKQEAKIPLLVFDQDRLYLYRHYVDETDTALAIKSRLENVPLLPPERLRSSLDALVQDPDSRRRAIALACLRPFLVISGGPGSGKTTTIARLLKLLRTLRPDLKVALAAPTGKAAARLTEVLAAHREDLQAATIHRLLRLGRQDGFGPDAPLPVDLLIVDEASMVDLALAARVVRALRPETRVIFVGDGNQLASVEAGSVLGDLTGRGAHPRYPPEVAAWLAKAGVEITPEEGPQVAASVVLLRQNYRFSPDRGIGRLAAAIVRGDVDGVLDTLHRGEGWSGRRMRERRRSRRRSPGWNGQAAASSKPKRSTRALP